jgi:UDP-glucose 6-dehydrogenase
MILPMSSVGIIGVGFVGDALLHSFKNKGIDVRPYDKYKQIGSFKSAASSDFLFLALPTLYKDEETGYDKSSLHEVSALLRDIGYKGLIVIKSTVEPGTTEMLAGKYGLAYVHNPEFLTARTAREDFENQTHIVLGQSCNVSCFQMESLELFYKQYYPNAHVSVCTSTESESMKIMANTFYAIKVQVFNEFYLYCKHKNIDYDTVKELILRNGWVNPMHTSVPGPDGKLSYGGACFPKDSSALLVEMKKEGSPCSVLEATKRERDSMRAD